MRRGAAWRGWGLAWVAAIAVGLSACQEAAAGRRDTLVAVAANFAGTMGELVRRYGEMTGAQVTVVSGSTGKLYAQIRNGAPFDAFFAADVRRPELLERDGLTVAGSRFTYAVGRLVLWSPEPGLVAPGGRVLEAGTFRRLAMANPELAPYGAAAREVLSALGVWPALQGRIAWGENIAQALQFVQSGNAELGFVAAAQLVEAQSAAAGSRWDVPPEWHEPIEQQAVLLRDRAAARAFLEFVRGEAGREIIRRRGYGTR